MRGMSKSLNFDVIAEGVETGTQKEFLIATGCENFQGYLFSKPLPPENLIIH
jgi:sensor c-di-GMP phosphodiesterase-like protein